MDLGRYLENRKFMETGDLIDVEGFEWYSRIIQWQTRKDLPKPNPTPLKHISSHSGMVIRVRYPADRVFILHATSKRGVHDLVLSNYLKTLNGNAWWIPLNRKEADKVAPRHYDGVMAGFLWDQLGMLYDFPGALSVRLPWIRERLLAWYCSELGNAALAKVNLAVKKEKVSPTELRNHAMYMPENAVLLTP